MEMGNLADVTAALAGLASAALAAAALRTAQEANATARKADKRESERDEEARAWQAAADRRERDRDSRDLDRDRRLLAGSLQAWWAARVTDTQPTWGVIISNEGSEPAAFRNVRITTRGNRHGSDIAVKFLPPGRYFVATDSAGHPWTLPLAVKASETYEAITSSDRHSIEKITFTDPLNTSWEWVDGRGLHRTSTS